MHNDTAIKVAAYSNRIALLNGVASAAVKFTVSPSVQQTLEQKIQDSTDLLKRINVVPVRDQEGAKLGLGVTGPIASRTKTSAGGTRKTRYPGQLDERGYRCEKTNYDTHTRYETLDAWAMFPDFEPKLRDSIVNQQGLDRATVGWNGTHVAEDTDIEEFPMLEDLNKGWLQHVREQAPQRVLSRIRTGGTDQAPVFRNEIRVGPGGDYENLDALVYDAIQMLDPWFRSAAGLKVFLSRELMHDKLFPLINQPQNGKSTEVLAGQELVAQRRVGGLPPSEEPNFPAFKLFITSDDNLSIYYQVGARRRLLKDAPERDQLENYESSNDAYVVEMLGKACLVENIVLGDWTPEPEE